MDKKIGSGGKAKRKPEVDLENDDGDLPSPEAKAKKKGDGGQGGDALRKNALLDAVATATGLKKSDVKATIEAALQMMGDALAAGQSLALPPLGRVRVGRQKQTNGGMNYTLKLNRPSVGPEGAKPGPKSLAEPGEGG